MKFQGAEAIVELKKNYVLKQRFNKKYRIPELDNKLILERTKREKTILEKCPIPCPKLISVENNTIKMSLIKGVKLAENLEETNYNKISKKIGNYLALLHNKGIIHGDLTTSNLIYDENNDEIYFIDFGLGFFSRKREDKAVDLHLFKQALESKHHTIYEKCFELFLKEYLKHANEAEEILKRFKIVEERGRYKKK